MNYLDTDKSVIISSPAGSGKTEKLARRYIALLQKGVEIERVLAITFTDKAAAEMKQRILRILKSEDSDLYAKLLERMPLMRVSTIHSFCGTLLRRFSFEAGIDPNYRVEDAIDSAMVWEEILYEVLMDAGRGKKGHEIFLQTLSEKGFRGLDSLQNTIDYLYQKSPFTLEAQTFQHTPQSDVYINELRSWPGAGDLIAGYDDFFSEGHFSEKFLPEKCFLTEKKEPRKRPAGPLKNMIDYPDWAAKMYLLWKDTLIGEYVKRTERLFAIFRKCMDTYGNFKKTQGCLDFSDLEYGAFKMLTRNPEWANILYAFDEKTDHVLVDEFQDTNTFQWEIINKLTEEWRSGMGAKREEGIRPTLFFVGDEKQSIYYFRGANVEIFQKAKEKMTLWLGDEFYYEEAKENYRSRPAIVEFTNRVCSKIMAGDRGLPWKTGYSPFTSQRSDSPDSGKVELILLRDDRTVTKEKKLKEAEIIARRIQQLAGNFGITDRSTKTQRPCSYMDMAILLRKRTHLKLYEDALRRHNIPFVAVKGIGYYQETEVAMLRALVFFLSNPGDDYSLYVLLKSPLFRMSEGEIINAMDGEGSSLYEKMKNASPPDNAPASSLAAKGEIQEGAPPVLLLADWISRLPFSPVAGLIEQALVETRAWRFFHEPQRKANIKKFIRIIEDLETNGKSIIKIRDFLERTSAKSEEPKANVNTAGMNAVKIMTIHAAKGLEFPVVFIPGLEEPFSSRTGEDLVYEKDGAFCFKSEPESSIRSRDEDFMIHQAREEEEQKRLFYVAVTRAEEALVLTSHWSAGDRSFLAYLRNGLGLEKEDESYLIESPPDGFLLLTEEEILSMPAPPSPGYRAEDRSLRRSQEVTPLTLRTRKPWKAVTDSVDIRRHHGREWGFLGDIIHRIIQGVSEGRLDKARLAKEARMLLESRGVHGRQKEECISIIDKEIALLQQKGIWQDIIEPRDNAYAELPFILEEHGAVYSGRIDRLIIDNGRYRVYDYKTYPVSENDMKYLLGQYSLQLSIYKKAVMQLFHTGEVKSYIVFTYTGDVREV